MAQRTEVKYLDDVDLAVGIETPAAGMVVFTHDGDFFEIDLGAANLAEFNKLMRPYAEVARSSNLMHRSTAGKSRPSRKKGSGDRAAMREWARANGWPDLPERGRIPAEVVQAYESRGRA